MGVFGLVNGQWQFFPSEAAAQAAGAVNVSRKPELRHKPGGPPRDPRMYWDEMTGEWRFPQPDGSTPGAMPSIGVQPGQPILQPFPPGGISPMPPDIGIAPPSFGPPGAIPQPIFDPPGDVAPIPSPVFGPPPTGPEVGANPFESYVGSYPDLAAAFKRYKSQGGRGDISDWGKRHYDKYGRNEKRKIPGSGGGPVARPPQDQVRPPVDYRPPPPVKKPPIGVMPPPKKPPVGVIPRPVQPVPKPVARPRRDMSRYEGRGDQ
jgi:hypothetical protein